MRVLWSEGARALWITFDPRCQTHRSARLSFFADKACRQPVMVCSGEGRNFRPFVIHGDTVYTRFQANNDEGMSCWGYRYHVSPMEGLQWLSELQVCEASRVRGGICHIMCMPCRCLRMRRWSGRAGCWSSCSGMLRSWCGFILLPPPLFVHLLMFLLSFPTPAAG